VTGDCLGFIDATIKARVKFKLQINSLISILIEDSNWQFWGVKLSMRIRIILLFFNVSKVNVTFKIIIKFQN
jgi:hypothetical protein